MEKDYENFIIKIIDCPEYDKALENESHECHAIVSHMNKGPCDKYACEPFRIGDSSKIEDIEVMFLGLSAGTLSASSPKRGETLEEIKKKSLWHIRPKYDTNYKNAMTDRIGEKLNYVKANVVHGVGKKSLAKKAIKTCGKKYLKNMIELFPILKYVIVYDFSSKPVLNFLNEYLLDKNGNKLDFGNYDKKMVYQ
jgi:hypothetical protein